MLPIQAICDELINTLSQQDVILSAPPGAGKSTYLPLQILRAFPDKKLLMLQPRRVAVRAIAGYLAAQLGESVGQSIGYRIRGESKVSAHTRLEIVTEGMLTRKLQADPELNGVDIILFDEFHERSVHADFSLALCLEVQQAIRDDLRLLVMSATLDMAQLQTLLPDAKVLVSEGRSFPINYIYRPVSGQETLEYAVAAQAFNALYEQSGSVLVFLPGGAEIRKVAELLVDKLPADTDLYPLYGELSKEQQQQAIAPCEPGKRKVVLATNIAETSLTIDGIHTVVDSGQEKVGVFHLQRASTELRQQWISQASATQRAGRAGRLGPGVCYRLWSQEAHDRLRKQSPAQILSEDMASFYLDALQWGSHISELALLDQPSRAQLDQAKGLLLELGALDDDVKLTALGRKMAAWGCHPRLAALLEEAKGLGPGAQMIACWIIALVENPGRNAQMYISDNISQLQKQQHHPVSRQAQQWAKRACIRLEPIADSQLQALCGPLLAIGWPDQVAKLRSGDKYQLANGTGAALLSDGISPPPWLAIAQMQWSEKFADGRILLAQPLDMRAIETHLGEFIKSQLVYEWQSQEKRIVARQVRKIGGMILEGKPVTADDNKRCQHLWQQVVCKQGLPLSDAAQAWLARVRLAYQWFTDDAWPDLSEQWLLENLQQWLLPYVQKLRTWRELENLDWMGLLSGQLDWALQQKLDELLPTQLNVPSGRTLRLNYSEQGKVSLEVKMQEVYGLTQTPVLGRGNVEVQMVLLSPAGRPIQTTSDLAGFWQGSYKDVQKEMKGRYPKLMVTLHC